MWHSILDDTWVTSTKRSTTWIDVARKIYQNDPEVMLGKDYFISARSRKREEGFIMRKPLR